MFFYSSIGIKRRRATNFLLYPYSLIPSCQLIFHFVLLLGIESRLLSNEKYQVACSSSNYAYYTPPPKAALLELLLQ